MTCSSAPRALMPLALARQHEGDDEIDGEARGGDDHHGRPGDRHGCKQPLDRLDGDPDDQRQHRERIDERGEHLGARVAVGRALRRRPRRHGGGDERDDERRRVGDHVARIRDQRERAREASRRAPRPRQSRRSGRAPPTARAASARLRRRVLCV